ncbi:unnamed protein product [Symbiodinium sp. CCMP2456]|nr:unnamed protein product [Symbiodinium sp. CCMP2456]
MVVSQPLKARKLCGTLQASRWKRCIVRIVSWRRRMILKTPVSRIHTWPGLCGALSRGDTATHRTMR